MKPSGWIVEIPVYGHNTRLKIEADADKEFFYITQENIAGHIETITLTREMLADLSYAIDEILVELQKEEGKKS